MARGIQVDFLLAGLTNSSGQALAGGKVYTYYAGSIDSQSTYTNQNLTTVATNPVILDSNGRASIFALGAYKFVIKDASDVTLYTWDNLQYIYPTLQTIYCGTSTGTVDDYILTPSPAIDGYYDGLYISFVAHAASVGGGATLNISGYGEKDFVLSDGSTALIANDIESGMIVNAQYVASTNNFRLLNAPGTLAVNAGGTGATTAADARSNLGLGATDDLELQDITVRNVTLKGTSVLLNTTDGSDNSSLTLAHNGSTRGGSVELYGNEHATPGFGGAVILRAGEAGTLSLAVGVTSFWQLGASGHLLPATDNSYELGSDSKRVKKVTATEAKVGLLVHSGNVVGTSTTDGSDDSSAVFGHNGSTRGGSLECYGNEHGVSGFEGAAILRAGASGSLFLAVGVTSFWQVSSSGHFLPVTSESSDIGSSSQRVKDIHLSGSLVFKTALDYTSGTGYIVNRTMPTKGALGYEVDVYDVLNTLVGDLITRGIIS